MHDVYEALVETSSPISRRRAVEGVRHAGGAAATRSATPAAPSLGAGIHPASQFGDVAARRQRALPRDRATDARAARAARPPARCTSTSALPDPETAIRAFNRLRQHLPAAAGARRPLALLARDRLRLRRPPARRCSAATRAPTSRRSFAGWDDYEDDDRGLVAAAGVADYTFLWWDLRPHPNLGTLEVRAMDAQARLGSVGGLAALVHGLALASADEPTADDDPAPARCSSSPRSAPAATGSTPRSGTTARCARSARSARRRPSSRAPLRARPTARALEEVERILADGNGADRMRAAHAEGGMTRVLHRLIEESRSRLGAPASAA